MLVGLKGLNKPRGNTPGNSWWGWPLGSPNPDPTSDQEIPFFTPVFRPDL